MRFATRVVLLQTATVVAVVAVCAAVFLLLGIQQLRAEAEASALNIARTIAVDPQVRAEVAELSADPGTPTAAELRGGELQRLAGAVTARTGTLFVVITDDHGIRLAHPDADLLGQPVSTDYREVLAGKEVVTWEQGTLGVSARAKVPVLPPDGTAGGAGAPVGEVSVGFEPSNVFDDLPALIGGIAAAAGIALILAVLSGMLLRRRWERMTLGLQPEELVALVQNQAAVLDGVGDGVVALGPDGRVRLCNETARELLGVTDPEGQTLDALGITPAILATVRDGTAGDGIVSGDRVLFVDAQPVQREGQNLGTVLIVRDRTDLVALTERLETVRAMTGALRVQRHEFANRLHVAAGLIDAGREREAREFLGEQLQRGPVDYPVENLDLIGDVLLHALIGAHAIEAGERGVRLSIAHDSLLLSPLGDVEDVAAVLGNLVDNAVRAAVAGSEPRTVIIGCYGDGDDLVLTVSDSGQGVSVGDDLFRRRERPGSAADDAAVHGLGVGLPLSRELARRRGGDVWLIEAGGADTEGPGSGAVFGARLCGVLAPPTTGRDDAP
ncbi:sensor histidine kinase [Microbacterium sp. VKM Ac-2870]|uniref:sensor histidine kinase n=1 Tax=Microbacterium sp. VKM Ac-2870 TaxID=2783825 RepID=UPI001889C53E|nr:sensor histidine kinase [Microbacterium sp. VKM Ac-2870]MBF4563189.1 sensor histidine kinase [Microbacterium sp. VKM Ac-2870]